MDRPREPNRALSARLNARLPPILTGPLREPARRGYVPVAFAARVVGRSPRTVRTWVHAGDVRTERAGEQLLVHLGDLNKLTATRRRRDRSKKVTHGDA